MKTVQLLLVIALFVLVMGSACQPKAQRITPSWQEITPGQTTKEQVLALLGEPDEIGEWDGETYFDYGVPDSRLASHKIFFRKQIFGGMIVSWMDVAKGINRKNPYYIYQALREYGFLDTATRRNFQDYGHLETLYVWSERGIALMATPPEILRMDTPEALSILELHSLRVERGQIMQRYVIEDNSGYINYSSPYDVVMRVIIFPPMEFDEFWSTYRYKIHYDTFIARNYYFIEP
jgi:hypothetical protein